MTKPKLTIIGIGRFQQNEDRVRDYIDDVVEYLFANHNVRSHINIRFNWHSLPGDRGKCTGGDSKRYARITVYCRWITRNRHLKTNLITLAHELVHAKQLIVGELNHDITHWKGKEYQNIPYSDLPWEKEADRLEEILYNKFWKE